MKNLLFPLSLLGAALGLGACSGVDPIREYESYEGYVVCSYDNEQRTAHVTENAKFAVKGDLTNGTFQLNIQNIPLFDGAPLRCDTVSRLIQYFETTQPDSDDTTSVRYAFFTLEQSSRQSGDLELGKMRFGWLSTQAWFTAETADGRYGLWSVPRSVRMHANTNAISGPYGETQENAISPRYDLEINATTMTAQMTATAVKYPVDVTDTKKTVSISSMTWKDMPMRPTAEGFTCSLEEFTPEITGKIGTTDIKPGDFVIRNFSLKFAANYEGERKASFELHQKSTGMTLAIGSRFDYYMRTNTLP